MASIKRPAEMCKELDSYFMHCDTKLNLAAEQSGNILCIFPTSAAPSLYFLLCFQLKADLHKNIKNIFSKCWPINETRKHNVRKNHQMLQLSLTTTVPRGRYKAMTPWINFIWHSGAHTTSSNSNVLGGIQTSDRIASVQLWVNSSENGHYHYQFPDLKLTSQNVFYLSNHPQIQKVSIFFIICIKEKQ